MVAVKAARLLDVKTGRTIERPVVVVRGGRIESVGTEVPAGATVVDLGDRILLPGLIDAHTHVLLQGGDTGVRIAVAAGVDSAYVAEPRAKEGRAIWAEMPKIQARSFENCRKAGVKIAFGTDAGGFPWTEINQAREFEYEVQHGMTPLEAIRTATTVAAQLLGLEGKIGTAEPGAFADLVAVAGDPLQDIRVLTRIDFVMKGGEVVRAPPAGRR